MKFFNIITAITTACLLCTGGAYGEDKDTKESQRSGGCHTASSWVFETSDKPFEEQSEESAPPLSCPIPKAKNSCTYQKADGTTDTFYYKITFEPDKITDPEIEEKFGVSKYPYIEMLDEWIKDVYKNRILDNAWRTNDALKNSLDVYKNMIYSHEEQHAVDFIRWPIIGNNKLGDMEKLYSNLEGNLPDAPEALKADYQRSQDLIKQMKKLENEIRTVMEARAVHAEICAHYDIIMNMKNQGARSDEYIPHLYNLTGWGSSWRKVFMLYKPIKFKYIEELGNDFKLDLALQVVLSNLHHEKTSFYIGNDGQLPINYGYESDNKAYTYIGAHELYFGNAKQTAYKMFRGSVAYINNPEKPDKSYKELDRLQQEYSDRMGELVAMYVKWKYYENAMPDSGYSISMEDINWSSRTTNWAVPAELDSLDYAERLIAILPQVDELIKKDDTNDDDLTDPIAVKFTELLKAKKRLFILESAKKPTEQELNEYEKRLLRAQGTIFHHIAKWVISGAGSSDELDIVVQVTINAPGFLAPPKPSFVETMRKKAIEEAQKRNRPTNMGQMDRPGSLAEYYSALGDLCQFMSTCNAEERKALAQPVLFCIGGYSSNKSVANIKKLLNESRQKHQNQSKKNSSRR